ncbi:hypothetical protein CAEBREN_32709 [Caenorhabditis brenneri]|uniref:Uncharacterized protein n=1 Tax=Caenorhabditis brenneri TaxID=135651 RepID=G0NH14_CAEBE|nr:hypothetical protein CAEBREN_32709 [Caenorhabditis brenneri]
MPPYSCFVILSLYLSFSSCQIFQEVPVGMSMGMGMGMPMGIGMPMGMPMHLVGNPFDQGLELEYSPITQLVSSVAHLFEMHQKSKEREDGHSESHSSQGSMFPELAQLQTTMRGRPGMNHHLSIPNEIPSNRPRFNLIPYSQQVLGHSETSSTSKLINSIPPDNIPPVMWRIGDLIGKHESKEKENLYDMTKIKGFPIIKSSENEQNLRDEGVKNKTNNSWTILEIARKILGVDELPTALEGNAIAQLLDELRKERESKILSSNGINK